MYFETTNLKIYYEEFIPKGYSNKTIVFLHGWGKDSSEFIKFKDKFSCKLIFVDFLGFGKSENINHPRKLIDYVEDINKLLEHLKVSSPILIGHSFGGRVAILYSYIYQVDKLILVNSAGIKPKRDLKYYYQIYKYKLLKKIYKLTKSNKYNTLSTYGSSDYQKLNDCERRTFSNIVNFDLKKHLKKIKTKALILSGVNDKTIEYSDGELMNKLLENSILIPFYNSGHFLYKTEEEKFLLVIERFIDNDIN